MAEIKNNTQNKKNKNCENVAFESTESSYSDEGMTAGLFWTNNNYQTSYHSLEHIQIVREASGKFKLGIRTVSGYVMDFELKVVNAPKFMPLPP